MQLPPFSPSINLAIFMSLGRELPPLMGEFSVRTVVVPFLPSLSLRRALMDSRSAINHLLADWRSRPDESRFQATKRTYPALRACYPHLASGWIISIANETSATLRAWDRTLRRIRRIDPVRFERMVRSLPRRRRLKVSLHHDLFRVAGNLLRITVRPGEYSEIDLGQVPHPLFHRYRRLSDSQFGLSVTETALLFHFRIPRVVSETPHAAGVDLNFESAVYATSEGQVGVIDLAPVVRIQKSMARKRASIQRHISKDVRHQRSVLRRYGRREHRRITPLLHAAANQLLNALGDRSIVMEDLTDATREILQRERRSPQMRRALSRWPHAEFQRIVTYKSTTPVVRVNPEGTSQECPQCEGPYAPPTGEGPRPSQGGSRRKTCEHCGGSYHRDAAAAIAVLARGCRLLRGTTVSPSARNELLEAARWRPGGVLPGPMGEPTKGDDVKSTRPVEGPVFG